ncbi:MAG: hypothetical protein A2W93_05630 [Bacteroidetes bacterium GWF2_43_63]|nr:MAG: hypothetical protein A2W94_07430 [Bacteroidetes bacterium GWE2_42_42]OFY55496.1 MAG: hypothetical protein A2W93_05630 [Bacteroidetes bacterium GWF2_43_63]HBG69973.1 hypothetical protein [Bacteroidales bacterium]HCB62600.1 hypothetical protein [Bacteroidales bacterium]HCY23720.1 hypothetical protein [Bacteroidales bacterium]
MKTFFTLILTLYLFSFLNAQEVKINNDLVVEADGTVKYLNNATVFDDLMVFPDATGKNGSKSPTLSQFKNDGSTSQGVYLWMFSEAAEQEVFFTVQLPHSYKTGTAIYPHVHWATTTGTPSGSDVVWSLEYSVIAIGGTFSNTSSINATNLNASISPSGTFQHLISSFPTISGTGLEISTVIIGRLYRNVGHGADTFANPVGLLGFDIHFEKDTDGSRTEYSK